MFSSAERCCLVFQAEARGGHLTLLQRKGVFTLLIGRWGKNSTLYLAPGAAHGPRGV